MIRKFFHYILTILCLTSLTIHAHEPVVGIKTKIDTTSWSWRLSEDEHAKLQLMNANSSDINYDISACMFCSGEEDNCDADGIYPITLANKEPALAVVCHFGAHSQKLQVLAPWRDRQKPVFIVTGDFWLNFHPLENGLKVQYDRRKDDGTIEVLSTHWPQ